MAVFQFRLFKADGTISRSGRGNSSKRYVFDLFDLSLIMCLNSYAGRLGNAIQDQILLFLKVCSDILALLL